MGKRGLGFPNIEIYFSEFSLNVRRKDFFFRTESNTAQIIFIRVGEFMTHKLKLVLQKIFDTRKFGKTIPWVFEC